MGEVGEEHPLEVEAGVAAGTTALGDCCMDQS